jgi:hypothetical protein
MAENRPTYYRAGTGAAGAASTASAQQTGRPSRPWIRTYRSVQERVQEFRRDHPNWSIRSQLVAVDHNAGYALAHAQILDENERVRSDGFKFASGENTPFVERAQTGAIGRALHFLGYIMQEEDEVEE